MTDADLLHEFDGALSNDSAFVTAANVQEMMPGPITPLNRSFLIRAVNNMLATVTWKDRLIPEFGPRYFLDDIPYFSYHGFLNLDVSTQMRSEFRIKRSFALRYKVFMLHTTYFSA